MSRAGITTCNPAVLKNLAIVCSFVCYCNQNPSTSSDGNSPTPVDEIQDGQTKYRQACVDSMLNVYNATYGNDQILVEQPFYVPKDLEQLPSQLPFTTKWTRLWNLIKLIKTDGVPQDVIDDYANGQTFGDLRGMNRIPGDVASYAKGELSIPDTVIVNDPSLPATPNNIQAIGEVKFPPDKWTDQQYYNATRIAGGKNTELGESKVETLTPKADSCNCDGEKQRVDQKAGQPALDQVAEKDMLKRLGPFGVPLPGLGSPGPAGAPAPTPAPKLPLEEIPLFEF